MQLRFRGLREDTPGEKTAARFQRSWPAYQKWFLKEGDSRRPGYLTCRAAMSHYMPELIPTWQWVSELVGGGDQEARMLSLYRPTPYLSGCSQAIWRGDSALLIRNYDYHPKHCDGVILFSNWNGTRVIAQSDSLWGVLDGINEHGLALSLAFGGRQIVGDGFGIPLVLRYILEFCRTAEQALLVLQRVPSHMAYNVHVLDREGKALNVHVSPDRSIHVFDSPVATNHQQDVEWTRHAEVTKSLEREQFLTEQLNNGGSEPFVNLFLRPPLYSTRFDMGFGTLYTAVYDPQELTATFHWPNHTWTQSFDGFAESELLIRYPTPSAHP